MAVVVPLTETILHPVLQAMAGLEPLRPCGSCSLCCKLVPVDDPTTIGEKPAGEWCSHCTKPGCAIYATRPEPCAAWSCTWVLDPVLSKVPDLEPRKCHVVIDPVCDEVVLNPRDGGDPIVLTVVQFWCDPAYPGAWRAPVVRKAMEYYAKRFQAPTLIRLNNRSGFLIRPPSISATGGWEESEQSVPVTKEAMQRRIDEVEHDC